VAGHSGSRRSGGRALTAIEGFGEPILRLPRSEYLKIIGHCYDGLPDEACGLLAGRLQPGSFLPEGRVEDVYLTANADASARTYSVDSRDLIKSIRAAEARGLELVGVFHSHTHTEAWPSPTDVRQAMEPHWLYVIVSLKDGDPVLRSFRITDGKIQETPVVLES
jgi:proteasome lid subunit RPN8/RPN11